MTNRTLFMHMQGRPGRGPREEEQTGAPGGAPRRKTSRGAPEGLLGRKLQGRQINDGEGGEGAILQLYSRAPKLMIHCPPGYAWIRP